MGNWHERSCRRPDVVVIDTMPTCMSCGSFYNRKEKHLDDSSGRTTSLVYDSLTGADEIRVLHLSPRKSADDQILHGFLESTSLSVRPDFTAVSYTWADSDGNRSLSEEIFLGDLWTPLPITPNCAAALRRLRSGHQIQTFWIDSICIDQASTNEKSHQVGLMRDIFSRATSVTIFLGGDENTREARLLKRTSDSLFYNGNQEKVSWDAVRDHVAVRALFDRPYWSRVWVVQEVLLSKKANVLGRALPIGDFHGLSILLTETSRCLATDPKDMVFALLGLVQGAHLEGLVADYSKSIQEIRVGIAAYFLIRHG
ncbi:heterokaryon incompatibility protein-domain-containing protein, partial [Diaporthe sp. PMI_573]